VAGTCETLDCTCIGQCTVHRADAAAACELHQQRSCTLTSCHCLLTIRESEREPKCSDNCRLHGQVYSRRRICVPVLTCVECLLHPISCRGRPPAVMLSTRCQCLLLLLLVCSCSCCCCAAVLCSLEKQVAFSTALMLEWCGATPVGTSEQVLQQLLNT
jgi:hypothetical protein